jgi:hypothetical protein
MIPLSPFDSGAAQSCFVFFPSFFHSPIQSNRTLDYIIRPFDFVREHTDWHLWRSGSFMLFVGPDMIHGIFRIVRRRIALNQFPPRSRHCTVYVTFSSVKSSEYRYPQL